MRYFWWFGPHIVFEGEPGYRAGYPWWTALLFALLCLALGVAIAVWPALLSILVASTLLAAGILILPAALAAAWDAWKHRPRRIRVRHVRSHR
jgi:hypothetical protein